MSVVNSKRLDEEIPRINHERLLGYYQESIDTFCKKLQTYPNTDILIESFRHFFSKPGKLNRPILFLSTLQALQPSVVFNAPWYRFALSLELFHNFSLIHDDLIDQSDSRRGQWSLHRYLENKFQIDVRRAENLALVMGDVLYGYSISLLTKIPCAPEKMLQAIRYYSDISLETGLGESLELLYQTTPLEKISEHEIKEVTYLKTTSYSIEAPIYLGFLLSDEEASVEGWLSPYARSLGMAFQLENDLHEVRLLKNPEATHLYDFAQGVRTLYLKKLSEKSTFEERKNIQKTLDEALDPRSLFDQSLLEKMELEIESLYQEASNQLEALSERAPNLKTMLDALIVFLKVNRRHSEQQYSLHYQ